MNQKRPVELTLEFVAAEQIIDTYVDSTKIRMFRARDKNKAGDVLRCALRMQSAFREHRFREVVQDLLRIEDALSGLMSVVRDSAERETDFEYAEFIIVRERKNIQVCMRNLRLLINRASRSTKRSAR